MKPTNFYGFQARDFAGFTPESVHFRRFKTAFISWFHLGSTYRCTGEYQKSIETFQHDLALFPNACEFNVFLGMAYYNIGEYSMAMALLLNSLADTSRDEGILRYRRAIHFYSDRLDQIW